MKHFIPECVNHAGFDDVKKNLLIKKRKTVNENGVLHVKATRVGSESALSQIVRLVESAQMAKAPVQKFADRIYKYFVPLVIMNCVM